jgi:hypothetical protein
MFNTYAWFVRGAKHAALCRTSIESVKKVDPKASILVATDDPPSRNWDIPGATIHQFESGMPIMLANLEAQCAILATRNYGDAVTFLDTDILMLEPLPEMPGADITVTWRDYSLVGDEGEKIEAVASFMPYNYGVIRAVSCYATLEAFIWMRERIRRMHEGHQKWYGNQLALFELAGPRPEEGSRVDTRRIPWTLTKHGNGVCIAKIPCARWNYTPQKVGERTHGTRSLLHFKGGSRALMESYATKFGLSWHTEAA